MSVPEVVILTMLLAVTAGVVRLTDGLEPDFSPHPDLGDLPRLAVLPFENISPDTADAYLAQGLYDEVATRLGRLDGFPVQRGRGPSIDYIMEAGVRVDGARIRVTSRLIDARDDSQLWSQVYDAEIGAQGLFSIQDSIAREVALALELELDLAFGTRPVAGAAVG